MNKQLKTSSKHYESTGCTKSKQSDGLMFKDSLRNTAA